MLYTGKGDGGTTRLFNSPSGQRITKSSSVFYALGSVDRLNSLLGICRAKASSENQDILDSDLSSVIKGIQDDLFVVQAELAGSDMGISKRRLSEIEGAIGGIEEELPKIQTFLLSGETEIGGFLDYARAISRDVERDVIKAVESNEINVRSITLAYLNRLSSFLYALARLSSARQKKKESAPAYTSSDNS